MFKNGVLILFMSIMSLSTLGQLQATIMETDEIAKIKDFVTTDSLVLFNVSDTLYKPSRTLADHQWREYFAGRVKAVVPDSVAAEKLINKVKNTIVNNIPKATVEAITPSLIKDLQQAHIPVLGITQKQMATAYAGNFGLITSNHLQSLGINLRDTLSFFNATEESNNSYSFAHGMLFTNKQPVGPVLVSFLEKNNLIPSRIIMVDNSQESLVSVEKALEQKQIGFVGLRYGRMDLDKGAFNPTLGTIEFLAYTNEGKMISDAEAAQIQAEHQEVDYEVCLDELIKRLAS